MVLQVCTKLRLLTKPFDVLGFVGLKVLMFMKGGKFNMTSNQINYLKVREEQRANLAREREDRRSNVARETETKRANLVKETETERSNRENERLKKMQNTAYLFNAVTGGAKNVSDAFKSGAQGAASILALLA